MDNNVNDDSLLSSIYTNDKKDNYNSQYELKTSGNKQSSWFTNIQNPLKFEKLNRNISPSESIDVVIIGGGIAAGLSTAYFQKQ